MSSRSIPSFSPFTTLQIRSLVAFCLPPVRGRCFVSLLLVWETKYKLKLFCFLQSIDILNSSWIPLLEVALEWEATAEMEWVRINCTFSWCFAQSDECQACNGARLALQIKVTALLAGWEWVAITAAGTELLMAWADTVSTSSLWNVCLLTGARGVGFGLGEGKGAGVFWNGISGHYTLCCCRKCWLRAVVLECC